METTARSRAHVALNLNRQDIDELVKGCRWVIEYRSKRTDVHADYVRSLRAFTEAQELARSLGMDGHPLLAPIEPLPIWNDDYRWADVLARTESPKLAKAA